ncbi:MAG: His/Gly/Thr/Pro-type tRNA ligase C-terminal domain-containing protein [Candidatus Dojkabacteria bacterium]|nr:His/Gly/Thr/Pro-type tRNA ligase C-terminal domain-containing protein [Candidatus Dojkabacteria bacterium]MDQ7020432.1 His/Gly/Thr/Pro-type tRNA ligase C-terminal domain-containing protein [Candidatus Dojkabacteria bacterium]
MSIINATDEEKHSAAHVLATAVSRVFQNVKVGIGPVTKDGFYYDFKFDRTLTKEDIEKIEDIANEIINEDLEFKQIFLSRDEAGDLLLRLGQIFKSELIKSIPDEEISFYKVGDEFIDLCRGPHIAKTSELGYIKISNLEKVHWKNDNSRPEMIRIHGLVFKNKSEFSEFVKQRQEKENRSFTNIIKSSGLGLIEDTSILLMPPAVRALKNIENLFMKNFYKYSPKNFQIIDQEVGINSHSEKLIDLLKANPISYKSLPLTYVHKHVSKKELNGKSLKTEESRIDVLTKKTNVLNLLIGITDNFIDTIKELSENVIVKVYSSNLDDLKLNTLSNYLQKNVISHEKILSKEIEDGMVKIEFFIKNSLNEVSLFGSFFNDELDSLTYTDELNTKVTMSRVVINFNPLIIFSSLVQDKGIALPSKVHPYQIRIIPISNYNQEYAADVRAELRLAGLDSDVDKRSRSINWKIRDAIVKGIPFIVVVGNKENANKAISLRKNKLEVGLLSISEAIENIKESLA